MALQFKIVIEPPDTSANWTSFNRDCDDLNSDFLMQPINEADYDSETQACVDARTVGGPRSFYDHYVTKRRKKRGMRGLGVEHPARREGDHQLRVTPTNIGGEKSDIRNIKTTNEDGSDSWEEETKGGSDNVSSNGKQQQTAKKRKQKRQAAIAAERTSRAANQFLDPHEGVIGEATVAALLSPPEDRSSKNSVTTPKITHTATAATSSRSFLTVPTNSVRSAKSSGKASAPPAFGVSATAANLNIHPDDFLDVPNKIIASKGALNNAAIRRIACGRNPTPVWNEPTGFKGKLPEQSSVSSKMPVLDNASPPATVKIVVLPNNATDSGQVETDTTHLEGQKTEVGVGSSKTADPRGHWTPKQFSIVLDGVSDDVEEATKPSE